MQLSLDSYVFPVESMVVRPSDGEVLNRINANDLLATVSEAGIVESLLEDPLNRNYIKFLREGLAKA